MTVTESMIALWVWNTRSTPKPCEILRTVKAEFRPRVLLGDDHAFIGLDALAVAFLDLDVDDDGVARAEVRQLALHLFGFEVLQQRVERGLVHGVGLLELPVEALLLRECTWTRVWHGWSEAAHYSGRFSERC